MNASKYTPKGGSIEIEAYHEMGKIMVIVKDNGVGIEEEFLERIFDPFYQVSQEGKAMQGLGIGLALAYELVELHGGKIEALSEGKNKGATFAISLPARKGGVEGADLKEPEEAAIRPGLKVLIIEDNPDILRAMPKQLELLGCAPETAATGHEGIEKSRVFRPDVILVDIGLPDISGLEVAKTMRANGFQGLMVVVSGYGHEKIQRDAKKAGFDYHLAKPASLKTLRSILSKA